MKKEKKPISYNARWGHPRSAKPMTHPKREARRERAYARGAERPKEQ